MNDEEEGSGCLFEHRNPEPDADQQSETFIITLPCPSIGCLMSNGRLH